MRIIATSSPTPFQRSQRTLLVPDKGAEPSAGIANALLQAAAKNVSGAVVAAGTWKLTTLPQAMSTADLGTLLVRHNVTPEKAPQVASDLTALLNNPAIRAILFGVSGGAAAYIVVERTSWPPRTKWIVTVAVGLLCSGGYLLLRHYGYAK